MQLRGSMILVLVVWLLMGWVRSQEGSADSISRQRRAHQRRMTMKKLAARGLSQAEQERMAEEILARLDYYSSSTAATTTTTTSTTTPPYLFHHRHRHHHQLRSYDLHLSPRAARLAEEMVDEQPPVSSNLRYSQEFLEYEDSEAETELLTEEEMEVEEGEVDMIQQYRISEDLDDLTRSKRERARADRRRSGSRRNRNERKEESRKRRERCKELRSIKKKWKKQIREVKKMVNNETIETYVDESGTRYIDCCPSVLVSVNKTNGKSRTHATMDIKPGYQVFTERLCMKGIKDKECIMPASSLKPEVSTRCKQQFSYSQAHIRPKDSNDEWKIGSIQVGSGCSCQISINHKKKKRKRKKR